MFFIPNRNYNLLLIFNISLLSEFITAAGFVTIRVHHGGSFSKKGVLAYVGGEKTVFRNCDKDRMSYFELVGLIKDVGSFNEGDKIFYCIPDLALDYGVDEIRDDMSIVRMLSLSRPNEILEIYVQPSTQLTVEEQSVSGNNTIGEATDEVNIRKV